MEPEKKKEDANLRKSVAQGRTKQSSKGTWMHVIWGANGMILVLALILDIATKQYALAWWVVIAAAWFGLFVFVYITSRGMIERMLDTLVESSELLDSTMKLLTVLRNEALSAKNVTPDEKGKKTE